MPKDLMGKRMKQKRPVKGRGGRSMDRLYAKALKFLMRMQHEQMRQVYADLRAISADKGSDEYAIAHEKILSQLDSLIEDSERRLKRWEKTSGGWDFSAEKAGGVFAEDSTLRLRPFSDKDKWSYYEIRRPYRIFKDNTPEDELIANYWVETQGDTEFFCMVERVSDGQNIGYITLKDTSKDLWEVAIELRPDYCGFGYGPAAILLFLNRIRDITGKRQYNFLVEVDNIPCQRCMGKIKAKLTGLMDIVFDDREQAEKFEKENLDMITEHLEGLAAELRVEPRKLLSNVLDYRLTI